jgi:hypothetical protein
MPVLRYLRVSSLEKSVKRAEERTRGREAEESPLLDAVDRERLVKTQQDAKRLSGCCGELRIVEISDKAVITCSSEWCV